MAGRKFRNINRELAQSMPVTTIHEILAPRLATSEDGKHLLWLGTFAHTSSSNPTARYSNLGIAPFLYWWWYGFRKGEHVKTYNTCGVIDCVLPSHFSGTAKPTRHIEVVVDEHRKDEDEDEDEVKTTREAPAIFDLTYPMTKQLVPATVTGPDDLNRYTVHVAGREIASGTLDSFAGRMELHIVSKHITEILNRKDES